MEPKISVTYDEGNVKVELAGRLDAANAPKLQEELKNIIGRDVSKLILLVKDLEYISSAGLRVIIFAKQKLGVDVQVYLIGAQETVLDVIKMSGLDTFMIIQDKFEE